MMPLPNSFITACIKRLSALLILFFYTLCQFADARDKVEWEVPNIEGTVLIDGNPDEAIWKQALEIDLDYETSPGENTKAFARTKAWIMEDGHYIYVAFKAWDPQPEAVKAYLSDRDDLWNSDFVGIKFDTFGEERKAWQFFVNAAGVQGEAIQEDFVGDDTSWDEIWDASAQQTDFGYQVELAIPYSALRFPAGAQRQHWSFELTRFMPRDQRYRFANTPVDRNRACQICQFDKLVGFEHAKAGKNFEIIPTLVVGRSDTRDDPANQPNWQSGDTDTRLSLDMRYGISRDIILNATVDPDFSQVEADAAQLDINNTFSLFLPEKRPFFVDGADYFTTPFRFVHSRMLVEPDYGLKVTGQNSGHSFGLMSVADKHLSFLVPGNQGSSTVKIEDYQNDNQILRYRYDLGNQNNIGLLMTDRSATDFNSQLWSLDGKFWLDENQSLSFQHAHSSADYGDQLFADYIEDTDEEADSAVNLRSPSGNASRLNYNYNGRNWWGYVHFNRIEKGFRADLGFHRRVDLKRQVYGVGHKWIADDKDSWWTEWSIKADWDKSFDISGKELEEESEIDFRLLAGLQSQIFLGGEKRNRYFNGLYFDENALKIHFEFQPIAGVILRTNWRAGDRIDFANTQPGRSRMISPAFEWQISQHWRLKTDLVQENFDVEGGRLFEALVANYRLTWQINVRSFLRFTRQSVNIDRWPENYTDTVDSRYDSVANQLLYSYKLNARTLIFAGYSDGGFRDDSLDSIEKTGRSMFMKFSYAWQT